MNEDRDDRDEEVRDVLMRGMHPTWHDLERAEILAEAKRLPATELSPIVARLIVALDDAHARLAKTERARA